MPDDSTQRFSQRAQNYARFRPGYPDSLVETLERAIGLAAGWVVADIGSGTGISSELFLKCGCTVFSVEPNDDMRRTAEAHLAGYEKFHSVAARAEETTLTSESVNLVVAGQAFHWFDATRARSEFRRILRHERFVALFWNNRKSHASPFQHDYERLVQKYSSECRMAGNQRIMHTHSVLEPFFEAGFDHRVFSNVQTLDFEGLKGRLLSSSYAPLPDQTGHPQMMQELGTLFEDHEQRGLVTIEYQTELFVGRPRRHDVRI